MMDQAEINEAGKGLQFCGDAVVTDCSALAGQNNVYSLKVKAVMDRPDQKGPEAGQFYLIKSSRSSQTLLRPISVYHSSEEVAGGVKTVSLEFLILEKGEGTKELCHLFKDDTIQIIGPLGNTFAVPGEKGNECVPVDFEPFYASASPKICVVGGGIGVAPVANFASTLKPKSYDFYASFRSGSYGLEHVDANELVITTDDGSVGIHGMLPAALTAEKIRSAGYEIIFACGPTPLLVYVQKVAAELGVRCYLSLEHRMACGVGACLGCNITTKDGNRRVCKDGPVFNADFIEFEAAPARRAPLPEDTEPDVSVDMCGVKFQNFVMAASGTFGYGQNYRGMMDVTRLGAICSKGMTLQPKDGNKGQRIIEVPAGNINSIGLENPGVPYFIENVLPEMMKLEPAVTIVNLAGGDLESYVEGARLIDATDAKMVELNISCPNVKNGGMAWGTEPDAAYECVHAVRQVLHKPLIVKLSPNAPDLKAVALAVIEAGADAISLINTIQAVSIDIENGKPFFDNIRAGLCGPAVRPIAVRMVYDVVEEMRKKLPKEKQVPVIGIGGIRTWQDAVEFIMAGACAVQVGTVNFFEPNAMLDIVEGVKAFMKRKGYRTIQDMVGIAQM